MNNWQKGSQIEKKVEDIYKELGWMTRRWNKSRFGEQDVFGVDIIAKYMGHTHWIQVKSTSKGFPEFRTKDKKELEMLDGNCSEYEKVLWVGYSREKKLWKVIEVRIDYTEKTLIEEDKLKDKIQAIFKNQRSNI